MKKTVIIGATPNAERYSYKATVLLKQFGHEVIPIGIKEGTIEDTPIIKGFSDIPNVHTITLYISKKYQPQYYNYILQLKPKRIIFNPETENNELKLLAEQQGIETIEACTLIMLRTGIY